MLKGKSTPNMINSINLRPYCHNRNIEKRMTGEVNPQRLKQTSKYFLHYKHLNTFDHPYKIHKCLDSEPSTFLRVNRDIIFNKFDKHISATYDNDLHWFLIWPRAPRMAQMVPTFWSLHLFKLTRTMAPQAIPVSDGRYTYSSLLLMISWWVSYLNNCCPSDFHNGLGGDSNSGPILASGVYVSTTRKMAPPQATPTLYQMKYTSVQVSYLWFPGGYHIWQRAPLQ